MPDVNEEVESCDEKNSGHTRVRCNSRNRCGCEPDGGRRSMAPAPWLSRRPRNRRLGGRSPDRRCARSTQALLRRVRAGLFRAAMRRPARTLLGRMGLALSPCRGLLLTRRSTGALAPAAAVLAAVLRQRNLEKLPIALDYDDDRIRRFTGSCQFESDPLGLLKGRGGIRKFLTEVVLEYRRSAPEMKIVARHGFPGQSRNI
jgi:hypothetical protein